jgi:hypothetical protein
MAFKLPETKEENIDFIRRCYAYVTTTCEVDLRLRDKYTKIIELTKDEKQKEEYKEKLDKLNKDIDYYEWSIKCMEEKLKQYESE